MSILIASSVVRGSSQGESHGGVYLIDLQSQKVAQALDWNSTDIDWQGRGWDRGLRGITFDGDRVFIAASDELFVYDRDFRMLASYRSAHLKHCHEIFAYKRRLYLTSTGYDAILGFDLDAMRFSWGIRIDRVEGGFRANPFLPDAVDGPPLRNELHLNNVHCTPQGLFVSGTKTAGLLRYTGRRLAKIAELPAGCHNARPYRNGILFNDTASDVVRYAAPGQQQRAFHVPRYDPALITHTDLDDSRTARQAFARGLCELSNGVIAAGSSPSTITLHDFESMQTTLSINLTMDVRNAIHGLEVWPFEEL